MTRVANLLFVGAVVLAGFTESDTEAARPTVKVGVASVVITPFGANPDWDGGVTESAVWGESFTDSNHNGRWDAGEPFEDDPGNTAIDQSSKGKYDGIYLAGFGRNRPAAGKHDDLWARALVLQYEETSIAIDSIDVIGYYSKANYYGHGKEIQVRAWPVPG